MKDDLILLAMALLVTLGSALLFSVRPKLVPFAVLGGVIGAGFYILCIELTSSHFFSNFVGAFAVTAYSEFCAIKLRAPAAIFLMPGNIPLVPGGGLFYTMKAIITQNGEELRNPETRQRVEKALRRALHSMLIGLEIRDAKGRKEKEKQIQIRFKWGFNLDAEDRERINKEREKQNNDLERFKKSYNRKVSKKANLVMDEEEAPAEDTDSATVELPPEPSEENAGMPSVTMTPPELRDIPHDSNSDASDEA